MSGFNNLRESRDSSNSGEKDAQDKVKGSITSYIANNYDRQSANIANLPSPIACNLTTAQSGHSLASRINLNPFDQLGLPAPRSDTDRLAGIVTYLILQECLLQQLSHNPKQHITDLTAILQGWTAGHDLIGEGQAGFQLDGGLHAGLNDLLNAQSVKSVSNEVSTVSAGSRSARTDNPLYSRHPTNDQDNSITLPQGFFQGNAETRVSVPDTFRETSNLKSKQTSDELELPTKPALREAIEQAQSGMSIVMRHAFGSSDDPGSDDPASNKLIIACPARKMPWDHNQHTAFFNILPETKHGDDLICSYPSCCERGTKFLYCKFCHAPVSKRHFSSRHSHSDEEETTSDSQHEYETSPQVGNPEGNDENNLTHSRKRKGSSQTLYYTLKTGDSMNAQALSSLSGSGNGSSEQSDLRSNGLSSLEFRGAGVDRGAMSSLSSGGNAQRDRGGFSSLSSNGNGDGTLSSLSSSHASDHNDPSNGFTKVDKVPKGGKRVRSETSSYTSSTRAVKFLGNLDHCTHTDVSTASYSVSNKAVCSVAKENVHISEWDRLLEQRPPLDDSDAVTKWLFQLLNASATTKQTSSKDE